MKTYKEFMQSFEEEIANNTSGVSGAGENPDQTVVIRKKHDRKNSRKDAAALLRRVFPERFENKQQQPLDKLTKVLYNSILNRRVIA